jgi:competence protein ComFC
MMAGRFLRLLSSILTAAIDLMIPPACVACHHKLDDGKELLCESCQAMLKPVEPGCCPKCGSLLEEGSCETCRQTSFDFELSRSVFHYEEPLTSVIHALKYRGHTKGTGFLANAMATYINDRSEFKACDYITAVPLHPVRKRERGYNQSELIARKVSRLTGIKYIKAVSRKRYTASQTMLHREQRLKNLSGAFKSKSRTALTGKSVILVDDVFTTGSTLNEISGCLHGAGVAKVLGLTACRAG